MKIFKKRQIIALSVITAFIFAVSIFSLISNSQRKANSDAARRLRYDLSLYNKLLNSLTTAQSEVRGYAFSKKQELLDDYFPAIGEVGDVLAAVKQSPASNQVVITKTEQEVQKLNNIIKNINKKAGLSTQEIILEDESWDSLKATIKRQITATEAQITTISNINRSNLSFEFWVQTTLIALLCVLLFLYAAIYLDQEKAKLSAEFSLQSCKIESDSVKQQTYEMVAHELRVPLQIIVGYLGLLRLNNLSQERIEGAYTKIDNAINRITSIVDTMLFLASDSQPVFQVEDLTIVCKTVIEQIKILTPNPFIIENIPSYPVALNINEQIFASFLYNLISNAIKYSPAGKPITVEVDQTLDRVLVAVSDRGIGIPEDELKKLFEPFYRASNAKNIKGTGLGLVVAKKSVEMHGGTLQVRSALGVGTVFEALFPKSA